MDKEIKNFLVNSEETGRQIVTSLRTGKKYFIEVIGDGRHSGWGDTNTATKQVEISKETGKYTGSVTELESVITEENGFKNILTVKGSPYSVIEGLDKQYATL